MPPPSLWLLLMIPIPPSSFQLLKCVCQVLFDVIWDVLAVPWLLAQEGTLQVFSQVSQMPMTP